MIKPKHDNFENAFKEAFDKVSQAPPNIIWENIEKSLPQETNVGTKSDGINSAIQSKLITGTGIILVSAITYLFFNNSSSKNSKSDLNSTKNETIFTKPIEPAIANTKAEIENLVISPSFVAKKQYKPQVKSITTADQKPLDEPDNIAENSFLKIDVNVSEMKPKGLHLPTITLETPDLVPNTDSQYVAPYYDPNAIENPEKNKSKFWQKFKISGGIRVSN